MTGNTTRMRYLTRWTQGIIFLLLLAGIHAGVSRATGLPAPDDDVADASSLSSFWQSAQQQGGGAAAAAKASQLISQAASEEIESWLSYRGAHARVTLDAGLHHSSSDLGLDYLYPFYESVTDTLFTQFSTHRWSKRHIVNIGAGWRHLLTEGWLIGSNLFYDQDLTRHHSRLGAGLEWGSDRVRGAFNYYTPLSGWRLSAEAPFTDAIYYDQYERAARGWDINLQLGLTSHTALKSTFFQWYGDKVDVSGQQLQASRNPYGIALGMNWQPVPLLTLRGEQRFISNQDDDTRIGMELHWQFGRSWREMLEPSRASALPLLSQSRTAFVERNNNIVLTYKAQAKSWRIYFDPAEAYIKLGNTTFTNKVKGNTGAFTRYISSDPLTAGVDEITGRVTPWQKGNTTITAETFVSAADPAPISRAHYQLTIGAGDFAPSVSDIDITGQPLIGNTLTGSYRYHDNGGDLEGATRQQWFRLDSPSQSLDQLQPVAEGEHYTVSADDISRYLAFQVIPVSTKPLQGAAQSKTIAGPSPQLAGLSFALAAGNGVVVNDAEVKLVPGSTGSLLFRVQVTDSQGKPLPGREVWWNQRAGGPGQLAKRKTVTETDGYTQVEYNSVQHAGEDIVQASLQPPANTRAAIRQPQSRAFSVVMAQPVLTLTAVNNPTSVLVGGDAQQFTATLRESHNLGISQRTVQWRSNGLASGVSQTNMVGDTTVSLMPPAAFGNGKWQVDIAVDGGAAKSMTLDLHRNDVAALVSDPASVAVDYGASTMTLRVSGGNSSTKHFASANGQVVQVDQNGKLTFTGTGQTQVTVSQSQTESEKAPADLIIPVTVSKAQGSALTVENLTLKVGETKPLVVSGGNGGLLSWSTSPAFTISNGKLTALAATEGTVNLTVSEAESDNYKGQQFTSTVKIDRAAGIPLQGLVFFAMDYSPAPQRIQLAINGGNPGGVTQYKSLNMGTATISATGLMTLHNAGVATIQISQNATATHEAPAVLEGHVVVRRIAGSALRLKDATMPVESSALVSDFLSGGNLREWTYSSSDNDTVAVDSSGRLTAKKGTLNPVEITVTEQESNNYYGQSATMKVTVVRQAAIPLYGPVSIGATEGDAPRSLAMLISGGISRDYLYSSDNPSVVSINSSGMMTYGHGGRANITVSQRATDKYDAPQDLIIPVTVTAVPLVLTEVSRKSEVISVYPPRERYIFTANVKKNNIAAQDIAVCVYWANNSRKAKEHTDDNGNVTLRVDGAGSHDNIRYYTVQLCP